MGSDPFFADWLRYSVSGFLIHCFGPAHNHPQLDDGCLDVPPSIPGWSIEQRYPGREQDGDHGISGKPRMPQRYASFFRVPDQELSQVPGHRCEQLLSCFTKYRMPGHTLQKDHSRHALIGEIVIE